MNEPTASLSTPVDQHLADDKDRQQERAAQHDFRKAMEGRAYGYEPTHNAWHWFLAGWKARQEYELDLHDDF